MSKSKLSNDTRKHYRNIGHNLSPIVTIAGNGLSEPVIEELNRALEDHELIKIKLAVVDRELRGEMTQEAAKQTGSEIVQTIGKVALLFRAAQQPNPRLSNVLRSPSR